jgi:ribosome-binding protein aMBF1 (putative translation factor)
MITRDEAKAARELLRWSRMTLTLKANISQTTISKFETGKTPQERRTASAIQHALEREGIELQGASR